MQISAIVRRKLLPISVIESVQNYTEAGKTVHPFRTYVKAYHPYCYPKFFPAMSKPER